MAWSSVTICSSVVTRSPLVGWQGSGMASPPSVFGTDRAFASRDAIDPAEVTGDGVVLPGWDVSVLGALPDVVGAAVDALMAVVGAVPRVVRLVGSVGRWAGVRGHYFDISWPHTTP